MATWESRCDISLFHTFRFYKELCLHDKNSKRDHFERNSLRKSVKIPRDMLQRIWQEMDCFLDKCRTIKMRS